ncbi:1774_t:CDS:2, partial [Gigaspora rosea]
AYKTIIFKASLLIIKDDKKLYDDRIEQCKVDRSMANTKLVNLKEGSLHSTTNYVDALKVLINISKADAYMKTQVLIAPMDYLGQLYMCYAVTRRIKYGDASEISKQILHIIPMIGPLHISLNSCETSFTLSYFEVEIVKNTWKQKWFAFGPTNHPISQDNKSCNLVDCMDSCEVE